MEIGKGSHKTDKLQKNTQRYTKNFNRKDKDIFSL